MSEEQTTETQVTAEKPVTMTEMLSNRSAPTEPQAVVQQAAEVPAPEPTPAPVEAPKPVEPAPQPEPPKPVEQSREERGLLASMLEERRKRQDLERQLQEMQQQQGFNAYNPPVPQVMQAPDPNVIRPIDVENNELAVKGLYKDYDAVARVFWEEAQKNPQLQDVVMMSKSPALAVYETGKTLMVAREYGTMVPHELIGKVRDKTKAELESEIRKQVEAEIAERLKVKAATPTNILSSRAAGGDAPIAAYVPPTFGSAIAARRAKLRRP